jgi:UDP-N-acetylmuramyl pentapeptide phosphotransferase/UDP-N-acetylglucosamine-1-phosphate transferase
VIVFYLFICLFIYFLFLFIYLCIYLLDHCFEILCRNILGSFPIFIHIAFLDDALIIYNMTQTLPHILIFVWQFVIIIIIINNEARFQDLIFLLKIPMGMRNYFFEICRKYGHVPLELFVSPDVDRYLNNTHEYTQDVDFLIIKPVGT